MARITITTDEGTVAEILDVKADNEFLYHYTDEYDDAFDLGKLASKAAFTDQIAEYVRLAQRIQEDA